VPLIWEEFRILFIHDSIEAGRVQPWHGVGGCDEGAFGDA
jgi:hypothetical protein